MKELFVYFEDHKVGQVRIDEENIYSFGYEKTWLENENAFPLSLSLPLGDEIFGNKLTLSFFENLLPEGEVRHQIEMNRGIGGTYSFLKEFGRDCAGAIFVIPSEIKKRDLNTKLRELPLTKLYKALDEKRPIAELISSIEPGYLSLAGAQDKFPTVFKEGKFYLPIGMSPTTHNVKTPIWRNEVKESVYNEYYCMKLAKAVGFDIPDFFILKGKHPLFVISRYDRVFEKGSIVKRIHQQDFCQAQGILSDSKYESNGGPSIKDNYELIKKEVMAKKRFENLNTFLEWISFNLLIGNNDSHSKNISFLMNPGIELAPFYDLLCTEIYPGLKRRFSFLIGDRDQPDKIGKNQFLKLEESLDLKPFTFQEIFLKVMKKVEDSYKEIEKEVKADFDDCKVTTRITSLIKKRITGFGKRLN